MIVVTRELQRLPRNKGRCQSLKGPTRAVGEEPVSRGEVCSWQCCGVHERKGRPGNKVLLRTLAEPKASGNGVGRRGQRLGRDGVPCDTRFTSCRRYTLLSGSQHLHLTFQFEIILTHRKVGRNNAKSFHVPFAHFSLTS